MNAEAIILTPHMGAELAVTAATIWKSPQPGDCHPAHHGPACQAAVQTRQAVIEALIAQLGGSGRGPGLRRFSAPAPW